MRCAPKSRIKWLTGILCGRARDFRRKQHLKQRHSRWRPPRTGPAAAADAISSGDEDDHQGDEHAAGGAGGFSRRKMASNTWRFEHDDDDETIERQYDRNMRELGLMSNQAPNEEPLLLKSDHPLDVLLPGERPEPDVRYITLSLCSNCTCRALGIFWTLT